MSTLKKDPLLTVIVPAYNAEKYLEECLESLVNQTVIDHKAIVVNDGSKDNTLDIIKKYAKKYPEMIELIDQDNKGQGAARNAALEKVNTEFVTFLDSDDWYDQMFIEKIKLALSKHDEKPDIIFTLPWLYDAVSKRVTDWLDRYTYEAIFYPLGGGDGTVSIETNAEKDKRLYELEASPCRRVYRMKFLRDINYKYVEGSKWEDVKPHFKTIHYAKKCIAEKSTGFFYRVNTGTQTTSGTGATRVTVPDIFDDILEMARADKWTEEEIAYIIRMLWVFTTWSLDVINSEHVDEYLKKTHILFKKIPYKYFKKYFNTCSPHRRKEMVKTWILRSPFYKFLKDYRVREKGAGIVLKIKRR